MPLLGPPASARRPAGVRGTVERPDLSAVAAPARDGGCRPVSIAALAVTAILATLVQIIARSTAPFPHALRLESLALSFVLYSASLLPALAAGGRVARILLGMPFGLIAMRLVFASGCASAGTLVAAGLTAFPVGVLLAHVHGTRALAALTAMCGVVACGMELRPAAVAASRAPSVLLVVLDTTSTRHLSAYGYARPTTPTLDGLARRALVYRRAISPASWTVPAHASIFSGLYPSELGFDGVDFAPRREVGSIAADVQTTGRTAYAISANPLVASDGIFRIGYRALWEGDRLTRPFALELLDGVRGHDHFTLGGDQITTLALDWVDRLAPRGAPWFLFLNYVDPHMPYRPPAREHDEFAPGIDPDAVAPSTQAYTSGEAPLTPAVIAAMRALYDGEIAAMDHALGRLLRGLAERGYDEKNLIVIVTADHGEALGEHGLIGHLRGLPDTVLHVPLLVSGPGVTPGDVAKPVQTVQLRATVRALLGLPALPGIAPALPPWGRAPSLLVTEHPEPRAYYEELSARNPRFDATPWEGDWVAVERDGVKVVFDGRGHGRTYRLAEDPDESHPRPLAEGIALARMYAARHRAENRVPRMPSPEMREALGSLGYVR
jgi:arylsulfatase A-like enzyme